jgi:hypothetical protein
MIKVNVLINNHKRLYIQRVASRFEFPVLCECGHCLRGCHGDRRHTEPALHVLTGAGDAVLRGDCAKVAPAIRTMKPDLHLQYNRSNSITKSILAQQSGQGFAL